MAFIEDTKSFGHSADSEVLVTCDLHKSKVLKNVEFSLNRQIP